MRGGGGGRWLVGSSLTRRFAILSFMVIAATTTALSFVISYSLRRDMLAREWHVTAQYIRLQAQEHLTPSDFADPGSVTAQRHFRVFYEQVMRMPEIVRVKVYDRSRAVVWSDEPRLIGQRFADNPQLAEASEGHTVANIETRGKKEENIFEGTSYPRLVELYVPLALPRDSGIVGIVETYKVPEQVFASIRRVQLVVAGTAFAGGALLWGSLFGIVRGAGRRIERQHVALEQRSRELGAANDELRSVQAQLVAAGRLAAIGEVVTAIAHGIRNPLANIRASAQVALLDCRTCVNSTVATAAPNLVNVINEVDRLGSRVSEMLRFVRPVEQRSLRVDLNEVVRDSLRSLAGRLAGGKVSVVERLAPALPAIVGEPVLLEQAFASLLENGLDAMGDGPGTLTVSSGVEPDGSGAGRVVVEVRDTGSGIAPEQLGKVFDLFYTTKSHGTGLGLALAKKFVEAYEGALTVASGPGEGTVFRATFPSAPPA